MFKRRQLDTTLLPEINMRASSSIAEEAMTWMGQLFLRKARKIAETGFRKMNIPSKKIYEKKYRIDIFVWCFWGWVGILTVSEDL